MLIRLTLVGVAARSSRMCVGERVARMPPPVTGAGWRIWIARGQQDGVEKTIPISILFIRNGTYGRRHVCA